MAEPQRDGECFVPPDPGSAGTLQELLDRLRLLKIWAGDPSYDAIKDRVNAAWTEQGRHGGELTGRSTVADCFRRGRRRVNADLVTAIVTALYPDVGYVAQWRQALRVVAGEVLAGAQVGVQDRLPPDLPGFTGRSAELDRLRTAPWRGGAVVIEGMAGVGKTRLAVHAGHLLAADGLVDRVLFVDLRGFHPDPAQPPADPAAVLDGFLRLLGMHGQQIPHGLKDRAAVYRAELAGTRTLVVLDNAADAGQVRPLLPQTPGCPVLVTSRRDLADLPATHLAVDVFRPAEAVAFVTRSVPEVPAGDDPDAAARIAHRCGHLPLALGLVTAHIRGTPGWTLTDHADRLDERHDHRRLDTGVELALDLSYEALPADARRLLRLAAQHPGHDLDAHAVAAMTSTGLADVQRVLDHLCREHLLHQNLPGRHALHDLVRAHALGRSADEDAPGDRRAALTRLFDFYLATTTAAMDTLYPEESDRRPRVAAVSPSPDLSDPSDARAWLDTERPTLVAVSARTATHGWPTHTTRLSATLFRYLNGGYYTDALAIYRHARDAARLSGDVSAEAHALTSLATTNSQLNRYVPAGEHLQRAVMLFRQIRDRAGEARALNNLGVVESNLGRNRQAADLYARALAVHHQAGNTVGEAWALTNLGEAESRLGEHGRATGQVERALTLFRQVGDRTGEAWTLTTLGDLETRLSRHAQAADHLDQALTLYRRLGNRVGEAWALNSRGTLGAHRGQSTRDHEQALALFRETGERSGEASALNGLGEAGVDALRHHTAALAVAVDIGGLEEQARAHTGLGHACRALPDLARARRHYQRAVALYTALDMPEAVLVRAFLTAQLDTSAP
ncbi:tetratricopeptide repeat protein [Lentzea sp. NPDC005914]|uniref:ATP-binding protein n=1 Tax=Lentzea sp. NPDC005914 TaxID=3154572 RepID=UPI0033E3270D